MQNQGSCAIKSGFTARYFTVGSGTIQVNLVSAYLPILSFVIFQSTKKNKKYKRS